MQQSTGETSPKSTGNDGGLSDEELTARGLVKIQAFTRATQGVTGSATRTKRAREKSAASGARQLNVIAPVVVHDALRTIAKDLQLGLSLSDVLQQALTIELQRQDPCAMVKVTTRKEPMQPKAVGLKTNFLALWKAWVARVRGPHSEGQV
jgi:hypothetical protein